MSRGYFYICGLGEITVDDVEFAYLQDLMRKIAECDEAYYNANKDKQLVAIKSDGAGEVITERVPLRDYVGRDLQFIDAPKEKPQIRIRSRSEEQINYVDAEFTISPNVQPSYKNPEVSENVKEKLILSIEAAESLLSAIGWDSETDTNVVEQAGLLIGNRYKDPSGFIWGKVTHIIPLKETQSTRRGILMTADSFYEASSCDFPTLKAEYPDLEIIGWYHTHTFSDQPVFSGTDYQTQSTTFSSHKSWFALVLNAQQRTYSAYYNRNAIMIQSFFECSDDLLSHWTFGINENYYGSEQKARIKKGAYAAEQERAELEKLRKELEEREKRLKKQESSVQIQERKNERERRELSDERKRIESLRRDVASQQQSINRQQGDLNRQQSNLSKLERELKSIQDMLQRVFPYAFEPNTSILGRLFGDPIRARRITSSFSHPADSALDVFYDPRKSSGGMSSAASEEIMKYGQVLNAIRRMVEILTRCRLEYCAVIDYCPPNQQLLLRSIIPSREISNIQNGNAIVYALDRYDSAKIAQIINAITNRFSNIQLYVYVEDIHVLFKKS